MGNTQSEPYDPNGVYIHATGPPSLTTSAATAQGPQLVLCFLFCLLFGTNSALYAIYLHLFGGSKGDGFILHLAVFISVACNGVLAIFGLINYYQISLVDLYSEHGYNINKTEPYVVPFHALQAIPVAIGQIFFALRIAKLFDHRRIAIRICVTVALLGVATQSVLMIWFGAAFYSLGDNTHLQEQIKRRWVRGLISTWTGVFIALELIMTVTTGLRLMVLRRHTTMNAARRVIFKLALYSVQGQFMLTVYSMSGLYLLSSSGRGKYISLYLLSGALYTLVLLANLIYRSVVSNAMKHTHSDQRSAESGGSEHSVQLDLETVRPLRRESREPIQVDRDVHKVEYGSCFD